MPESLLRPEDTEQHLSMLRMSVDEALFQDHVSATFQIAKFAVRMTHIPKTEPVRHSSEVASFIVDRVVVPILSTTTNEEFWRVVSSGLKTYQRAVEAFHLAREMEMESEKIPASIEPPFTPDELFEGSASTLFGAPGAEEASFMCATMKRAAEMTSEIGAPRPDETAYAREFHLGATLFEIGTLAVVVAPSIQERTTKGTEGAFELARRGALEAYAAVRQVADLREAEKEDGDMSDLPFDDGDAELVDFYPL